MIAAAGLGTRLRPLTELRPKPALPVRGIPLIAYTLALLAHHGVKEVIVNTHHLPDILMDAARRHCPLDMELRFSIEAKLLDTGGGIRRVADYLRESDPCLIVAGDMLLDADLSALVATHRERGDAWTMLLRDGDPREKTFGTVGVDSENRVRRIGTRHDFGGEHRAGLYAWANVVAARAFESLPDCEIFSHFDGWVAPQLESGVADIRGEIVASSDFVWEPVGTPAEYLAANLDPIRLSYQEAIADAQRAGARIDRDLVIGAGAELGSDVRLRRAVVWDGERVPNGLDASNGVFAGGAFHPVD
jgi:NDP-sugar pyrophosphorylase family protein